MKRGGGGGWRRCLDVSRDRNDGLEKYLSSSPGLRSKECHPQEGPWTQRIAQVLVRPIPCCPLPPASPWKPFDARRHLSPGSCSRHCFGPRWLTCYIGDDARRLSEPGRPQPRPRPRAPAHTSARTPASASEPSGTNQAVSRIMTRFRPPGPLSLRLAAKRHRRQPDRLPHVRWNGLTS